MKIVGIAPDGSPIVKSEPEGVVGMINQPPKPKPEINIHPFITGPIPTEEIIPTVIIEHKPVLPPIPPLHETESVESKQNKIKLALKEAGCDSMSVIRALDKIKEIVWGL